MFMSISLSGNLVDGQDGGNMEMSSHKSDDRLARKRNAKQHLPVSIFRRERR